MEVIHVEVDYEKLIGLMCQRQSIRKFKDVPLTEEEVRKIVGAAVTAPSSLNSQPWSFVVITDRAEKKRLMQIYGQARKKLGLYEQDVSFVKKATPIVVVCEDDDYGKVLSCAMAIQNMFLAAESIGLCSLPSVTILMDPESTKELEGLVGVRAPKKIVLVTYFGYKDEAPNRKPKKELSGLVFENTLGEREG